MFVDYRSSLLASIGLHVGLVIVFTISLIASPEPYTPGSMAQTPAPVEVVKAVSVDQAAVAAQIQAIKQQREAKQQAELAAQQQAQQQLAQAKQQRQQEEQRLKTIQQQQQAEQKKITKELADLKQQQQREQQAAAKKLADLKQQQQQEQQRLQQLQHEQTKTKQLQQQEQQRLAELAAEREAQQQADQARISNEMDRYKNLILQAISQHWILPDHVDRKLSARFEIRLGKEGQVLAVKLLESSQDPVLDRSAQTAIYNASPLPVPKDAQVFNHFQVFHLTVRPEQIL